MFFVVDNSFFGHGFISFFWLFSISFKPLSVAAFVHLDVGIVIRWNSYQWDVKQALYLLDGTDHLPAVVLSERVTVWRSIESKTHGWQITSLDVVIGIVGCGRIG